MTVKADSSPSVGDSQTVGTDQSAERAETVIADGLERVGLHIHWRIGVAALVAIGEMARQAYQPGVRGLVVQPDALFGLIHLIHLLVEIAVAESAVVMMIQGSEGEAELIRQLGIIRNLGAQVVIASVT